MTRHVTQMTLDDAEHYTEEERQEILASYLPHEREARARGIPQLGSGRVFPVTEESLVEEAFETPSHWCQIGGMDFGWDHPFAAVQLTWDRDSDIVHVVKTYRIRNETPIIHASHLKPWGQSLVWAWPHDGLQHDKGSGEQLAEQYRKQGLSLLPEKATHEAGGFGLEAGIMDMLERMQSGRFKVSAHLEDWWQEFRLYHRKAGRIVKERDDLMSATRMALMMLRYSQPSHIKTWQQPRSSWVV